MHFLTFFWFKYLKIPFVFPHVWGKAVLSFHKMVRIFLSHQRCDGWFFCFPSGSGAPFQWIRWWSREVLSSRGENTSLMALIWSFWKGFFWWDFYPWGYIYIYMWIWIWYGYDMNIYIYGISIHHGIFITNNMICGYVACSESVEEKTLWRTSWKNHANCRVNLVFRQT